MNHGLFEFNQTYSPVTRRDISKRLMITRVSNNFFKNCLNLHISNKLDILNKYANGSVKKNRNNFVGKHLRSIVLRYINHYIIIIFLKFHEEFHILF